jgi:membrane fusion protein, multidrug efflux system
LKIDKENLRSGGDRRQYDRRNEDRKRGRGLLPKILISLFIVGGIAFLYLRKNTAVDESVKEVRVPVKVSYPVRGTIQRSFRISGYVETEQMVTVLPKISGTLTNLYLDVGDTVEKGQVIGTVDSESYGLTLRQAEAAYLAAKSTYERMEQLYQANATSKQNYDQAKSQYDAAKSQYELAQLQFNYTDISAPVGGVVLQKHTSEGSLVAQQVPIVTIGDLDRLVVNARIPEKYYAFFETNKDTMEIEAELPALNDKDIRIGIQTISPFISPETKTFEVRCTLTGETSLLRPGMFLYLTFVLDKKSDVLYLPFEALVGGDTLWYIKPENCSAGTVSHSPSFFNDDVFELPEQYEEYPFIIEGQNFLREGQKCRVLNKEGLCGEE